jgi:alkyldihydroxyacetonephosphate synthase
LDERAAERFAHARDLWPRDTLSLAADGELPPSPIAVAFPESEAHVAAVLAWATDSGVPIIPWGAGSGVCGAARGSEGAVALDLKRMRGVGTVDPVGRRVEVDPGVIGQHFEDELERQGWASRHSPSSIACSTVGGWAASRSAGQFSSRYGKFDDMVLAARVVAPARTFGIGEWAAGEDLADWVLGAEGALGVITRLSVRVSPVARARWLRGYHFPSLESAWTAMRAIMQAGLQPLVLRLYDPVDTLVGGKAGGPRRAAGSWWSTWTRSLKHRYGSPEALLRLPFALPGLVNAIAAGVATGCVLIAGWEGDAEDVAARAEAGRAILGGEGRDLGAAPGEHWYGHRHDVSFKLAPVFAGGGFADTMEVAATWSRLPALYAGVRAAVSRHALVMAHFSHAYREGCNIYFSFAGRGGVDDYDRLWAAGLAAAAQAGCSVTHHHGVGQLKMRAAGAELAGAAPMFRRLKAMLDPKGILNPGRMFPDAAPGDEPPPPEVGIDAISQVATLPAGQDPAERDTWLAERGWALRHATPGPLASSLRAPVEPWDVRVLGASIVVDGRRHVFVPVPRSASGPEPRRAFPAHVYETVTVPVSPRTGP